MKKVLSIILVLALLLPVLAGCQSSAPAANQTDPPAPQETTVPEETTLPPETTVETTPVSTDLTTVTLTRDEAIDIALKDAGLKKDQVYDLDAEIDRDNGVLHYDVDFEKDDKDYDYEIHAESGEILKKKIPAKTAEKSTSTTEKKQLTKEEARNIALKDAGVTANQVRELEVELDRDDSAVHYDVDFEKDGYDYEYEIHAESGKILKSRKERD